MAKGNKNTHLSYIIEFNAIIPVKKQKTNLIKLLQWKKIYTVTPFFLMMKRYKFIHIDKLQKCSCYLTSLLSYWDRMLLVHTFQFFNEKFHCTLFQIMYIFSENGYCFDLLIFKASPWLSTLTLKRTLDFFPERHGSLDHDIRSDAKSTHLLIVISQTEPVLSCINIMNTFFSSTVQPFH